MQVEQQLAEFGVVYVDVVQYIKRTVIRMKIDHVF